MRSPSRRPSISAVIKDSFPRYQKLYQGTEPEGPNAAAVAGDNLIRARIAPTEGGKLYYQTIPSPSLTSPFASWTYSGQTGVLAVGAAASGDEVCLFWIRSNRAIYHMISTNSGLSWESPQLIGYTASTTIGGLAACFQGENLYLFYGEQIYLRVMKRTSDWSSPSTWDKTTGNLSGVSATGGNGLRLAVSGLDTASNPCLWMLSYNGAWGELKEVLKAPSGSGILIGAPSLTEAPSPRLFFHLNSRIYVTDSVGEAPLWAEPQPFPFSSSYGLLAAPGYLTSASTVWQKEAPDEDQDISGEVLSLKEHLAPLEGTAELTLKNNDLHFSLHPPRLGAEVAVRLGYVTPEVPQMAAEHTFFITGYEYHSAGGRSTIRLWCADKWQDLKDWRARYALSWPEGGETLWDITGFLLARAGITLVGEASNSMSLRPAFIVGAGTDGLKALRHILGWVDEGLVLDGQTARSVPLPAPGEPVYSYGEGHSILEGTYLTQRPELSHLRLEGQMLSEAFGWDDISGATARYSYIRDTALTNQSAVEGAASAILSKAQRAGVRAVIKVPLNAGQELYDVVRVKDKRAGLEGDYRVIGIESEFWPDEGRYEQIISLGGV